ncbi:hypothetical protein LUZ60_013709 [Juncus effusus]|nr:hypothetical protein LUZ60_013709 [Juncus effusus]
MEVHLFSLPTLIPLILFLYLFFKGTKSKANEPPTPPAPPKYPIIGHMHYLIGTLPFRALRDLANQYGPLIQLRIGQVDLVVATSKETAEEILKTHDLNFASRPELVIAKVVGYNCTDVAFAPYGPYWKQLRKICFMEVLGAKRVRSFSGIRGEEIYKLMKEIANTPKGTSINISTKLFALSNTIVSRAAFGKKRDNHEHFLEIAKQALEMVPGFTFQDTFPSLKFLDVVTGASSRLERIRRELDETLSEIIKDHTSEKDSGAQKDEVEDLVDVMLRLKDDPELEIPMTLENVKAVILDLFIAGSETSSNVTEWAMSELMRNPRVMEKAQKEVRETLKGKTKIEDTDLNELNYLKLVVKEALRIHPPVPMLIPRVCKETCQVTGYTIKAGTRVFVNAWAMGRDPKYWDEPETFRPERFEGNGMDFKGASFEYLPFGSGRRVCPGMIFGLSSVDMVLAQMLYYFDWSLPNGLQPHELDMSETFGSNASRGTPLLLLATPSIPLPSRV